MPEGDTLHRAAATLHAALAGRRIRRFETVLPQLARVDLDRPLAGRVIERVEARGKHLLMWIEGDLVLRTHMRMHGSWHIYRVGERWQRPRHQLRIRIETDLYEAVAFAVPVAEFIAGADVDHHSVVAELGPDLLSPDFGIEDGCRRVALRPETAIADVLLDQRVLAGIGNVFKSEILFVAGVNPFTVVGALTDADLHRIVTLAVRLMRANVGDAAPGRRRTTGRMNPSARLWVYGRGGQPCRRCGTSIQRAKQGPDVRSTYWCSRCQPLVGPPAQANADAIQTG